MVTLAIAGIITLIFYRVQNAPGSAGGNIAAVKTLWLLCVIIFWYVLPAFWVLDRSLSSKARLVCLVALANMVLRAVVELWMMYISHSWMHSYGIGHDIVSVGLCTALLIVVRRDEFWLPLFFAYCALLFAFETYFAYYLRGVSDADGSVFFLASSDQHAPVLQTTAAIVAASVIMGIYVVGKWSNAEFARRSPEG